MAPVSVSVEDPVPNSIAFDNSAFGLSMLI